MLPRWSRGGNAVNIPMPAGRRLTVPIVPLVVLFFLSLFLLTRAGLGIVPAFFTGRKEHGHVRSAFVIDPELFLPPDPIPHPDYLPLPLAPKETEMVVPNSVHYIYGLKPIPEGGEAEQLPYYAYLAMRSAMINLEPEKIYFHYEHLPQGPWWDLIRPNLTLVKTVVPDSYLGRPLYHFAHKADVLRLLTMKYTGGIYLDIDMFVVKSFDDLLYEPTTLAMQMSTHSEASALEPQGLCNAAIVAAPHSSFIDRWLASYETFEDSAWDEHSVNMPWRLARRYPHELQVLSNRAFFYPMWFGNELEKTHETTNHDFRGSGQYAYHAWESLAMGWLSQLSPNLIREKESSFNRLVRPFIGPDDDAVYEEWTRI